MKKISPTGLFYSMMVANALFTLATLLGAFSGKFSQIIPFVIIAMTVSFIVFAILFFSQFKSFGIWLKISGLIFVIASSALGLILSVMSTVVLPEENDFQDTLRFLAFLILPLGALLFASFFQTYFWLATTAGILRLGLLYLAALGLVMVGSFFIGNIFGSNLGLTTLAVCLMVFILNRKTLLEKSKPAKK